MFYVLQLLRASVTAKVYYVISRKRLCEVLLWPTVNLYEKNKYRDAFRIVSLNYPLWRKIIKASFVKKYDRKW